MVVSDCDPSIWEVGRQEVGRKAVSSQVSLGFMVSPHLK